MTDEPKDDAEQLAPEPPDEAPEADAPEEQAAAEADAPEEQAAAEADAPEEQFAAEADAPEEQAAAEADAPEEQAAAEADAPEGQAAAEADAPEGQAAAASAEPAPSSPQSLKKADLGKRFIAGIIDAVIAVVIGFIPILGGIIATVYWLVRDGLEIDFMDHRSIGKKLVNLRPVTLDGLPLDVMASVKRNWMFALGGIAQLLASTIIGLILAIPLALLVILIGIIEVILVLTDPDGRRLGDKIANTQVIEVEP